MEEIDLKDMFLYFVKRIFILLLVSILFLFIGVFYTRFFKTPLYTGDTTLILVSEEREAGNGITQNDILLNQKLVATYSEIIKSRSVLNQVIENLNLNCTFDELSEKITVSSVSDTEIIKISVVNEDPKLAAKIANSIAVVFEKEIVNIYNLKNVSIIDRAIISEKPYNIQILKTGIIFFVFGLLLTCMILFICYYFDDTVKSSEEIEKKLGLAVVGNIPIVGKREK